jgi:hypothetical protein
VGVGGGCVGVCGPPADHVPGPALHYINSMMAPRKLTDPLVAYDGDRLRDDCGDALLVYVFRQTDYAHCPRWAVRAGQPAVSAGDGRTRRGVQYRHWHQYRHAAGHCVHVRHPINLHECMSGPSPHPLPWAPDIAAAPLTHCCARSPSLTHLTSRARTAVQQRDASVRVSGQRHRARQHQVL